MNTHDTPIIKNALKEGKNELMLAPTTNKPTECIIWGETGLEHVTNNGIETITETELQERATDWFFHTV